MHKKNQLKLDKIKYDKVIIVIKVIASKIFFKDILKKKCENNN
jgi:hypothetical protein